VLNHNEPGKLEENERSESLPVSLPCLHDIIFGSPLHKIMRSPSDRRMIWWLCMSRTACDECHRRLTATVTNRGITYGTIQEAQQRISRS